MINVESFLLGEDQKYLANCFMELKENKTNPEVCKEKLQAISRIISRTFNINVSIDILDTEMDDDFFGINIYPDAGRLEELSALITAKCHKDTIGPDSCMNGVKEIWKNINQWHMDIDGKVLYSLSNRFSPQEITVLLISEIENTIFCTRKIESAVNAIKLCMFNAPHYVRHIMRAKIFRKFYMIPILRACEYSYYSSKPCEESIFAHDEKLNTIYMNFLTKLVTYYGNRLVDRNPAELENELSYTTSWIFVGINDCKYHLQKLKNTLLDHIRAEKSPYVAKIMRTATKELVSNSEFSEDDLPYVIESTYRTVSPKAVELREKMALDRFTKIVQAVKEDYESDLLDKLGKCKRVSDEEIDVLRLEIQKIESVDDKVYYMEKVYDKLEIVDYALALIDTDDLKGKVKDTKSKLLKQKSDLMLIRDQIMTINIAPKRYGLFIKYPRGYEG